MKKVTGFFGCGSIYGYFCICNNFSYRRDYMDKVW